MATQKPAPERMLSRRVLVIVDREMSTKTARVVWEHEIPILLDIFGDGKVMPVDPASMDEGYEAKPSADLLAYNKKQDQIQRPSETACLGYVFGGDAHAEYQRLAEAYGKHKDVNILLVEKSYGRFQDGRFERAVGQARHSDMPAAQLRELILGAGYLPTITKESTDAEKHEAQRARAKLMAMAQEDLVKQADSMLAMA